MMDAGQKTITITHLEQSSGELKNKCDVKIYKHKKKIYPTDNDPHQTWHVLLLFLPLVSGLVAGYQGQDSLQYRTIPPEIAVNKPVSTDEIKTYLLQ